MPTNKNTHQEIYALVDLQRLLKHDSCPWCVHQYCCPLRSLDIDTSNLLLYRTFWNIRTQECLFEHLREEDEELPRSEEVERKRLEDWREGRKVKRLYLPQKIAI